MHFAVISHESLCVDAMVFMCSFKEESKCFYVLCGVLLKKKTNKIVQKNKRNFVVAVSFILVNIHALCFYSHF